LTGTINWKYDTVGAGYHFHHVGDLSKGIYTVFGSVVGSDNADSPLACLVVIPASSEYANVVVWEELKSDNYNNDITVVAITSEGAEFTVNEDSVAYVMFLSEGALNDKIPSGFGVVGAWKVDPTADGITIPTTIVVSDFKIVTGSAQSK
jgi:hypothetical protein